MKSEKRNSQKKAGDSSSNFAITQRILMFCMVVIFLMLPVLSHAQNSTTESTLRQSAYLENHGRNATTFTFSNDNWQYVIVKLKGTYQKDFTKKPSQNFTITVNGETIFSGDLYGGKTITRELNYAKASDLVVSAKLISVHGASSAAAGNVEVVAFRERPGLFYVTEVVYDMKNAQLLEGPELLVGRETIEENNTNEKSSGTYKVTYTETNSLTWEKSFEHSESVGVSVGYKASSATGGLEAMASLAANFKTAYKTGSTKQSSESIERSTTYEVPPHTTKRIFAVQSNNTYKIPYRMKGYTLDDDGNKKAPFEKKDTCIFIGVQSTRILQESVDKNGLRQANTEQEVIAEWSSVLK